MSRPGLVALGLSAAAVAALANLYAALYLGTRCGDQTHAEPSPGSARARYCDLVEDPDDRITFLTGLWIWAPLVLVLAGAVWAVIRDDARVLTWTGVAGLAWLLLLVVVPALVLPAG
jgi:hypothetical protein